MLYESEYGLRQAHPSAEQLRGVLRQLDGVDDSYASLTLPNGDYIQVGGGGSTCTVEVRLHAEDGSFRQLKAFRDGEAIGARTLYIGGAEVTVRANQVFDVEDVLRLFCTFGERHTPDMNVSWEDITPMFSPPR